MFALHTRLRSRRLPMIAAGIVTVALLAGVPAPASAASVKPPKALCFNFNTVGTNWALTTKAVGKVTTAGGTVATYDVSAAADYGSPWSGSGIMQGSVLHATLSSRVGGSGNYHADILWDTVTSTGTANYSIDLDGGGSFHYSVTLSPVDCSTVTISGAP